MISSNFLKVLEHLLLPYRRKIFLFIKNQFAYRHATGCIDAITVLKKTAMSQIFDVYFAMLDLSKAYDRINTSLLCEKMRETELPGQVITLIDFMGRNTFVCTSYGEQLSDE